MTNSHAALNFRQRAQRVFPDGMIGLVATGQDFLATARLFTALDTTGYGQSEVNKEREAAGRYIDRNDNYGVYNQRSPEVCGILSSASL